MHNEIKIGDAFRSKDRGAVVKVEALTCNNGIWRAHFHDKQKKTRSVRLDRLLQPYRYSQIESLASLPAEAELPPSVA